METYSLYYKDICLGKLTVETVTGRYAFEPDYAGVNTAKQDTVLIVEIEKGVFAGYFSCTDINGKPYDSLPKIILNVFACVVLAGVIICIYEGTWSAQNFWRAIQSIIALVLLEMLLSIPWYFLGKKFDWIRRNRRKLFVISGLGLVVILLILANMFGA